jgi:hypothetical protein
MINNTFENLAGQIDKKAAGHNELLSIVQEDISTGVVANLAWPKEDIGTEIIKKY